ETQVHIQHTCYIRLESCRDQRRECPSLPTTSIRPTKCQSDLPHDCQVRWLDGRKRVVAMLRSSAVEQRPQSGCASQLGACAGIRMSSLQRPTATRATW